jgi:hypothetical protein
VPGQSDRPDRVTRNARTTNGGPRTRGSVDRRASEIETTFADALVAAAADGRLAAYFARPHVFHKNEAVTPTDESRIRATLHEAWRAAATGRGPRAAMVEAVVRVVERSLSLSDDAPLRTLYREALALLRERPKLDESESPRDEALGERYPRRRFARWRDFENESSHD